MLNYINDNLQFAPFADEKRKKHVTAVNGAVTAYMRKRWGIAKIREDGDLHHAADAVVIACVGDSIIQKVSAYSKQKEVKYTDAFDYGSYVFDENSGEVLNGFPLPYPEFRTELDFRLRKDPKYWLMMRPLPNYSIDDIESVSPAFVSRMTNHKVTGAAHKDTIRSGKEKGFKISKTALSNLKLDKNGEILNYYSPESDRLLYDALKVRLTEFNGNAAKAFPTDYEFHKPKADGTQGPIVKKVKLKEKSSLSVPVRSGNGIADNGSMVRIDVFYVENEGYYFVPIYVADTVKKELPDLACVAGNKEWKKMDDSDFVFSLYSNDLIKVTAKKDMKLSLNYKDSTLPKEMYGNELFLYYINADISNAAITAEDNDGAYVIKGLGIKTLRKIEKYTVDAIGNISKVNKEKRMRFSK